MAMYKNLQVKLLKVISSVLVTILLLSGTVAYGDISNIPSDSTIQDRISIPPPVIFYGQKSNPLDYWLTLFTEENPKGYNHPSLRNAAYDGKGRIVAVGSQYENGVLYSADGKTWKSIETPFYECWDVAYGDGVFAAVSGGRIYYSDDCVNWEKAYEFDGNFLNIEFGNGIFLAVGNKGGSYGNNWLGAVSSDGINWKASPEGGSQYSLVGSLMYANKSFWMARGMGTYITSDGSSWQRSNCPEEDYYSVDDVLYGNGVYLLSLVNGIYTSNDGVQWNKSKQFHELVDLVFAKDRFFALTRREDFTNELYSSEDGDSWVIESVIGKEYFMDMLYAKDRIYLFGYANKVVCSAPLVPPMDPELIQASVSNGKVKLMWNSPNDTSAIFGVYRSTSPDSGFSLVGTVDNGIYYYEPALPAGTYYYKVIAGNVYGTSDFSNVMSIKTGIILTVRPVLLTAPSAPSELKGTADSPYEISLSWKDNFANESGFKILRKSGSADYLTIGYTESDETSYTDTGLIQDTTYEYKVCAFNSLFDSDASNEVSVTTERRIGALEFMPGDEITELISSLEPAEPEIEVIPAPIPAPAPVPSVTPDNTAPPKQVKILLTIGSSGYSVNGTAEEMDAEPIIKENRTLIPFRYIAQAIGAVVNWNSKEQKVTVTLNEDKVELWIGNNTAMVNGKPKQIDPDNPNVVPVIVPPGRTMTPLRFIAESLGCKVRYDPVTSNVEVIY